MKLPSDTITVPVDFTIRFNKQKVLLDILQTYSNANLSELSNLLGVSNDQLNNVLRGNAYLNPTETKKLVTLFCICCGN